MKKHIKHKKEFAKPRQAEPDVAGALNKIQETLAFLEKKINTLIGSSPSRPAEAKHFQKPFQQYGYSRDNRPARQDSNYRERVLHKAVCADCGKECEVPFKPSGERPVYCRECFSKRKAGDSPGEHRGYSGKKKTDFRKRRSK